MPEVPSHPSGLLISVRDAAEWQLVQDLPVDVIDFKEPEQGALAPTSPQLWKLAASAPLRNSSLSAALGSFQTAPLLARQLPREFAYAKACPAGAGSTDELATAWDRIRAALDESTQSVAVAYADYQSAHCPTPREIFLRAAQQGLRTWLIDTHSKSAGQDVTSFLSLAELRELAALAQAANAIWVLAGSLSLPTARRLSDQAIRPQLFGVRGDICDRTRETPIVRAKVEAWLTFLNARPDTHRQEDERDRSPEPVTAAPATSPNS